MLLARLFQALEHPADRQESLHHRAPRRAKGLIRQAFDHPVIAPRSQRGGAPRSGHGPLDLTVLDGIIPKTGVFIP